MGVVLSLLASAGVPERLLKPVAYAALLLLAVALIGGGWAIWRHQHDKHLIEQHDAQQAAQVAKAELDAERTANANAEVRQQEHQTQTKDLNDARAEAQRSNPDEAAKPAGPATAAVLRRLREQQAASNKRSAR